jgi:hypothetical protein
MEKRINKKFETYLTELKDSICKKIVEINLDDKTKTNELLEFVYEYPRFSLQKEDLNKRKRVKNSIPDDNRCNAKRANNEQCTRRRKEGCEFCGTHSKGTPNGLIDSENDCDASMKNMEVFAQEICGIVYYIDTHNNVYNTEDIMSEKQNPQIIAKYKMHNDKYTIPELGLV